jgi:hypothetical protein
MKLYVVEKPYVSLKHIFWEIIVLLSIQQDLLSIQQYRAGFSIGPILFFALSHP